MRKKYAINSTAIILSVGLVYFALQRLGIFKSQQETSINHWARLGRTEFESIPVTSLKSSLNDIQSIIVQKIDIHKKNKSIVNDVQTKQLTKEISSFLYYRFSQKSVDEYLDWRRSEGYRFKSIDELIDPWFIDESYINFYKIGDHFPNNPVAENIFRQFWEAEKHTKKTSDFAKAIAQDADGLLIVIDNISKNNPTEPPLNGNISFELWYGAYNVTLRNWWTPHHTRAELLTKYDSIPCASVGIITEFGDGSRRPLDIVYYFDPADNHWILQSVSENNFVNDGVAGLEY